MEILQPKFLEGSKAQDQEKFPYHKNIDLKPQRKLN